MTSGSLFSQLLCSSELQSSVHDSDPSWEGAARGWLEVQNILYKIIKEKTKLFVKNPQILNSKMFLLISSFLVQGSGHLRPQWLHLQRQMTANTMAVAPVPRPVSLCVRR